MCHHYKLDAIVDELFVSFRFFMSAPQIQIPLGSFYPTNLVPVIKQCEDDAFSESGRAEQGSDRELVAMEWGMLPSWWKPSDKCKTRKTFQRRCFNARAETVHEKPSYRDAFKRRRCLVPVTHFEEKGHYFSLTNQKLFAFAGLWESWQGAEEIVHSCTFLTTEPNAEIRSIGHHRMPIVLRTEEQYAAWLNPDIDSREPLAELLYPAIDGLLDVEKMGK